GAPTASGDRLAAHEEENRPALRDEGRARGVCGRARAPTTAEEPAEHVPERTEGDRGDAGGEARERQALPQEHRVHEQVIERRAVAHDVDERSPLRELAQILDRFGAYPNVTEEEANEE